MPRPRPFPVYPAKALKHSGGAKIKINQKSYYLGRHGSDESYREYERLRAEHATGLAGPKLQTAGGETIEELVVAWLDAEPRGHDHHEVREIRRACEPMLRLFGPTRASDFRANRLRAVQDAMIDQRWMTAEEKARPRSSWSRQYINKQIERLLRIFRWGESTERLPFGTLSHLQTVPDLAVNDRRVRNSPPWEPLDYDMQVKPILKHLSPVVRAMVQLEYLTGMRPSEILTIRRNEIDQSRADGIWLYEPATHKSQWRGLKKIVAIGPQAQRIIAPWLMAAEPADCIFPPSRRYNGAESYTYNGYRAAIARAIAAAGVKKWTLYQLRRLAEERAEAATDLAGASAHLGHESLETTKRYRQRERVELAAKVAAKVG